MIGISGTQDPTIRLKDAQIQDHVTTIQDVHVKTCAMKGIHDPVIEIFAFHVITRVTKDSYDLLIGISAVPDHVTHIRDPARIQGVQIQDPMITNQSVNPITIDSQDHVIQIPNHVT